MSNRINRRKLVPERVDRGGTLRYAWLRAPPLRRALKINPKPRSGRLTQKAPYEGGQSQRVVRKHGALACPPKHLGIMYGEPWTVGTAQGAPLPTLLIRFLETVV